LFLLSTPLLSTIIVGFVQFCFLKIVILVSFKTGLIAAASGQLEAHLKKGVPNGVVKKPFRPHVNGTKLTNGSFEPGIYCNGKGIRA